MQLPTLPSWMRNGLPGVISSNSPFPPLKPDKRYRGVYERAGFDVNLDAVSGSNSPTQRQSPYATPSSANKKGGFSPADQKHRYMERTPSLVSLPLKTPMSAPVNYPSFQASPLHSPYHKQSQSARSSKQTAPVNPYSVSTRAQRPPPGALYTPQEESFTDRSRTQWSNDSHSSHNDRQYGDTASSSGNLSQYQSHQSHTGSMNHLQSDNQSQPSFQPQSSYQQFQSFQPSHRNDEGLKSIFGLDDQSDKNKKHLKLDIQNSNFATSSNTVYHDAHSFIDHTSNHSGSHNGGLSSGRNGSYAGSNNGSYNGSYNGQNEIYNGSQNGSYKTSRSGSQTGSHSSSYKSGSALQSHAPSSRGGHSHRSNPSQSSAFSATSVQTCELLQSSAPYPTKDLGQIYTPASEKDLSSMLADFKQDVEQHRLPHSARSYSGNDEQMYNSGAPYDKTFPEVTVHQSNHSNDEFDSSRDDLSLGRRLRDSDDTGNSTAEDIPLMLHEFEQKKSEGSDQRLSTISSILSKGEHQSHPDDEIERELERQLESLKTGSKASFESDLRYNDSYTTASEQPFVLNGSIPSIVVSEGSVDSRKGLFNSELIQEAVTPLFARKDNEKFDLLSGPATPHITNSQSLKDMSYDTPETIKPLSPKTHHYADFSHDRGERSDEEILSANCAPQEFDAFPRSVFDPHMPMFRTSGVSKVLPGTGNCRTCSQSIEPGAKGPMRPIFSKSGELSGQWHRGCFKCSHDNCLVTFNKQVTPYVLLDNPFCHHHYHSLNDTLCSSCNLGIEGECIENELRQKWHVQCLKCSHCKEGINNDYYCVNNEIFCERDASMVIEQRKKLGFLTSDKVEKRRTRLMYLDQGPSF